MFLSLRKISTFPLIGLFLWASVVCCCLSQQAHAEDVKTSAQSSHCESHDPKADHSGENHECECPKLQGTLAKNFDVLKSADIVFSFIHHNAPAVNSFFSATPDLQLVYYEHSPPHFDLSSLLLYLKYCVLRI